MTSAAEQLEPRRLLASIIEGTVLSVTGTAGNDRVAVYRDGDNIATKVNGVVTSHPLSQLSLIVVDTRRGDDVIEIFNAGGTEIAFPVTVWAHAGRDFIQGGDGPEHLFAGDDDDTVFGGDGRDTIYGGPGPGNDFLRGEGGSDLVQGEDGNDTILGDGGNDHLFGDANVDRLRGGAGNDDLHGGGGRDYLAGENDNDLLRGDPGDDVLSGGAGDDTLDGGRGADELTGGPDADNFWPDPSVGDVDQITDGPAAPILTASLDSPLEPLVHLTFDESTGQANFTIEQSKDGGKNWTVLNDPISFEAKHGDCTVSVQDGSEFIFRMYASAEGANSAWSNVTDPITIPVIAPFNLTAYSDTGGSIQLKWADYSTNEDRFEVFQLKDKFRKIADVSAVPDWGNDVEYGVEGLTHNTSYTFFIRAIHGSTYADSDHVSAETFNATIDTGPYGSIDEIDEGTPYELALKSIGVDPATLRWEVDWGDDSPLLVIPAGSTAAQRMLTHDFPVRGDYRRIYVIDITATGPGLSIEGTEWVQVDVV